MVQLATGSGCQVALMSCSKLALYQISLQTQDMLVDFLLRAKIHRWTATLRTPVISSLRQVVSGVHTLFVIQNSNAMMVHSVTCQTMPAVQIMANASGAPDQHQSCVAIRLIVQDRLIIVARQRRMIAMGMVA
jgi:hypothetical protein